MAPRYRFLNVHLDVGPRQILIDGVARELAKKNFEVLLLLVENAGNVVTKEQILDAVWTDAFVSEASIHRSIATLRQTLGTGRGDRRFIATVPGVGYRFLPEVEVLGDDVQTPLEDYRTPLPIGIAPAASRGPWKFRGAAIAAVVVGAITVAAMVTDLPERLVRPA